MRFYSRIVFKVGLGDIAEKVMTIKYFLILNLKSTVVDYGQDLGLKYSKIKWKGYSVDIMSEQLCIL